MNKNDKNEIEIDFLNEISVSDLIITLDKSKEFSLYEIIEENENFNKEKNFLIKIKKRIVKEIN